MKRVGELEPVSEIVSPALSIKQCTNTDMIAATATTAAREKLDEEPLNPSSEYGRPGEYDPELVGRPRKG